MKAIILKSKFYYIKIAILSILFSSSSCIKNNQNNDPNNKAPNPFKLVSVKNKSLNVERTPVLVWEQAIDPDGDKIYYDVYLSEDSNNFPTIPIAFELTKNEVKLPLLPIYTKVFWKVTAKDKKGGITDSNIYFFTTRNLKTNINYINSPSEFPARHRHKLIKFDNKLWIIGGDIIHREEKFLEQPCDIWTSTDGEYWNKVTTHIPFNNSISIQAIVFRNKLIVIGEFEVNGMRNVIQFWSTKDGVNWKLITPNIGLYGDDITPLVFQDKLWVIHNGYQKVKIWNSSDAKNWILKQDSPDFSTDFNDSNFLVYKDKIWLIGGWKGLTNDNEVWNSTDGIKWELVTKNPGYKPRWKHATVIYDYKMWIIGGESTNTERLYDMWFSRDGVFWKNATNNTPFKHILNTQAISHLDKLYIVGGARSRVVNDQTNQVWAFD
ncbi:hypothetical protein [Aquimarina spinulae]|uniref:hypothetical protein n=1 Tax=Aquimarina spinulae TaxID=1192023 RepID=UPI000D560E1A|nr:hypothetical protein [Aquimarina spinulae]